MALGNASMVEIKPSTQIFFGNPSNKIKIHLFGDYEDAATAQAHLLAKQMVEKYPEEVVYSFRHFPLTKIHQQAHKAAEAAVGAAQEGKFWEMHERLLAEKHLGTISLKTYAKDIGISDKKFFDKLMNSTYGWSVREDLLQGLEKGVRSVPCFVVNEVSILDEKDWNKLPKLIKQLLSEL